MQSAVGSGAFVARKRRALLTDAHNKGACEGLGVVYHRATLIVMTDTMKTWMCLICGWIYDEEKGAPDDGIAPGTKWEDVPPNWTCPECGARKEDFEMVEI
jgi:rubredoxin